MRDSENNFYLALNMFIYNLNYNLQQDGCIFRLKCHFGHVDIIPANTRHVFESSIKLSKEYQDYLAKVFEERGCRIKFNDTANSFSVMEVNNGTNQ